VVDLSAFYLDIIKDRLYVEAQDGRKRRSAQTVLWQILMMLLEDMAPVLSFTAEEAFQQLPEAIKNELADLKSIFALRFAPDETEMDENTFARWEKLAMIRAEVNKAIEPKRKDGVIGKPLDAHITLYADEKLATLLQNAELDPMEFFIVSKVDIKPLSEARDTAIAAEDIEGLKVDVAAAPGEKCERCWRICEDLGTNADHPTACPRCTAVLTGKA
jgi:isoleucyl-tRNA synthetase